MKDAAAPRRNHRAVQSLECAECGRVSRENERGWTAHLTVDEDEPAEAVIYCPECDEQEFGERIQRGRSVNTAMLARLSLAIGMSVLASHA